MLMKTVFSTFFRALAIPEAAFAFALGGFVLALAPPVILWRLGTGYDKAQRLLHDAAMTATRPQHSFDGRAIHVETAVARPDVQPPTYADLKEFVRSIAEYDAYLTYVEQQTPEGLADDEHAARFDGDTLRDIERRARELYSRFPKAQEDKPASRNVIP